MKTFKISSPAYKANGLNGTYYSIAVCDDNNVVMSIVGDHTGTITKGSNVMDFAGQSFSDSDRFIRIVPVNADVSILHTWEKESKRYHEANRKWWSEREAKFGSVYDFIYAGAKNANKENEAIYEKWLADNPSPKAVHYYDFLKAIKNVDEYEEK